MRRLSISFLLILLSWSLSINAKAIHKGSSNEALLVGQISGPSGGATRNLLGMILSMNVIFNNTAIHSSLMPITTSTFPLNYSVILNDHNVKLENAESLYVVSTIWQPAYIYEAHVKLPENPVDTLNFEMRTIKFVIIRGEISHDKHDKGHDLPATQVKLEIIEDGEKGRVIDQVDFICKTKTYPCPFEYWLDTAHIKADTEYKLEAILADRILPPRKSTHQKHQTIVVETKSTQPATFKINPKVDTEINDFEIIVGDVQ